MFKLYTLYQEEEDEEKKDEVSMVTWHVHGVLSNQNLLLLLGKIKSDSNKFSPVLIIV